MKNETENKPVNQGRRRLAQGGLAGSVVLASLISKHALASVVPYHCTKSGKFSGTNSTYGQAPATCVIGYSKDDWIGKLEENSGANKNFHQIFGVGDKPDATILQILKGDVSLAVDNLFAQQAIVLYLNAGVTSPYPLTQVEVVTMFGCAYGENPSKLCDVYTQAFGITDWTAEEIGEYFARLYR